MKRITALVARVQRTRPVRVLMRYGNDQGPLLASGLAYQALFAIFAALWVGFSIAGLVISGDRTLRDRLIATIAAAVPGLIATDGGTGAIDPSALLKPGVFSVTGVVALVGLLITALGFLASLRQGIRIVFGLPSLTANPILQKLKDLGVGLVFAVVIVVSATLSFVGTTATGFLLGLVHVDSDSTLGTIVARIVSIAVMFAIDAVSLGLLYRVLSGVRIPWREMRSGVLIGAAGLGILKILFSAAIIGGVGNNPLLKSFAVILGLLIFFNFVCQVILIASAWIAVGLADRGVDVDPAVSRKRVLDARQLLLEHGLVSGVPVSRRGTRIRIRPDSPFRDP